MLAWAFSTPSDFGMQYCIQRSMSRRSLIPFFDTRFDLMYVSLCREERDKAHATAQNAVSHDGAHADTVSFEMTLLEVLLASSVHHHQKVVDDLLQVKRLINGSFSLERRRK